MIISMYKSIKNCLAFTYYKTWIITWLINFAHNKNSLIESNKTFYVTKNNNAEKNNAEPNLY